MPKIIDRIRLRQLLTAHEVVTSADLKQRIRAKGVSDAYAGQMLRRQYEAEGLWRSERLKLSQNERLFAHSKLVGTSEFFKQVEVLLRQARPGIARCLRRLAEEQVVHRVQMMKLLASPLEHKENVHRPAIERELEALVELGIRSVMPNTDFECYTGTAVASGPKLDDLSNLARVALRTELLLARILGDYIRRMNLVSWGRLQVGGPDAGYVAFNNQPFTAVGYSYLDPVVAWKAKGKPTGCPVLVDVHVGRCTVEDVASFKDRLMKATHRGENRQQSLSIIAAKDFEPAALKEARRSGFVTVNFRQLYGQKALEAIETVSKLLGLVGDTGKQAQLGIPTFADLLEELKTNPVVVRIRSIAFEAVTGLVLQELEGCHGIRLGLDAPFFDPQLGIMSSRDVDVYGIRGDKAWVVECKAYHSAKAVDYSEVKRFYAEVVPAFIDWYRKEGRRLTECYAEFWTTGRITDEVRAKLTVLLEEVRYPRGVNVKTRLRSGSEVQNHLPHDLSKQCGRLLDAIATHESPEDE